MSNRYGTSMFIGNTKWGHETPVFFDPHMPAYNNKPPGTLITGSPGAGKTFLALTLTAMSSLLGKNTIVIDPKNDFISLLNLKSEIGEISIWDLKKGKEGLLDPFYMSNDNIKKITMARNVIGIFAGGLKPDEVAVLTPILEDMVNDKTPSLMKVVEKLRGSVKESGRNLGARLNLVSKQKYSNLCFYKGISKARKTIKFEGTTIISTEGLKLPKMNSTTEPTDEQRLGEGILYLLTTFIRRFLEDDPRQIPKTLVIDEAHALVANREGASVIQDIALLGRSKEVALIMITQNNSHIEDLDIENTISTRFAFNTDRKEADSIVKSMQLPEDGDFGEIVTDLKLGECLMKDYRGKYSIVKISDKNSNWKEAFNTNPLDKRHNKKENDII